MSINPRHQQGALLCIVKKGLFQPAASITEIEKVSMWPSHFLEPLVNVVR